MARKLFSPRTKSSHRSRRESKETVCVQVWGTFCVGVSAKLRTEFWQSILATHGHVGRDYDIYRHQEISSTVAGAIAKDVGRTFPEIAFFGADQPGQTSLKNVLSAYAAYDPELGYCQGMNFLAGLLLLYLPAEADAFGALVMVLEKRGLRELYTQNMTRLEVSLFQLLQLLPEGLTAHLEATGALPVLFASSWFLTCFAASFPLQFAARIVDVVLSSSAEEAFLLKVAYTMLMKHRKAIVAMDAMEDILQLLTTDIPDLEVWTLHEVISAALKTPWTQEQRAILDNTAHIESVYETVSRVEDETPECRRHQPRRSLTPMALLLPQFLLPKPLHPIQFLRRFR